MKIINGWPPNIEEIAKAFPLCRRPGVIFAYHDAVYAKGQKDLSYALQCHEQVHLDRQGGTVEGANEWWAKYMVDAEFRFHEELLAHVAEYHALQKTAPNRFMRKAAIGIVSQKLASPLYGWRIKVNQCRELILKTAALPA